MARITKDVSYGTRTMVASSTRLSDGKTEVSHWDQTISRPGNELVRSDLIRRKADETGFRKPTPYSHEKVSPGFFSGIHGMTQLRRRLHDTYYEVLECQLSWPDYNTEGTNQQWSGKLTPPASSLVSVPKGVKNEVRAKLRKRLKDEQWNAAVTLREMRSSFSTIEKAASSLQRAMFCAMRKDWVGLARALGVQPKKLADATTPASAWLAYHFAWAPIVSDMVGAANFLATAGEHQPRLRVAAGARLTDSSKATRRSIALPGSSQAWYSSDWAIRFDTWDEVLTDYKLICWYKLDQGWLRDLSKIGFTNPLDVIYQTTPFSWLTEWLIPVGEVLTGLDATIGLEFISGTETVYREVRRKVSEPVVDMPVTRGLGTRTVLSKHGEYIVRGGMRSDSVRNVLTSTPFPNGLWIKNPFSPWRIATSVALMRQLTGKFRFK